MKENTEKIFHLTMLDADNKDKLSELEEKKNALEERLLEIYEEI